MRLRVALAALLGTAVLAGAVILVLAARDEADPPPAPAPEVASLGEAVGLAGGGSARLDAVHPGATAPEGSPAPEPGVALVRIDVEVCAGDEAGLAVGPSLWLGRGEDHLIYSAHQGVHDLQHETLPPGECRRGSVDLAVAEDVVLAEVLLMHPEDQTTAARWTL